MLLKRCGRCGVTKSPEEFNKDKNRKEGVGRWCKECQNQYKRQYYQKHKEDKWEKVKKFRKKAMENSELDMDYTTLHHYIKKIKPKPEYCEICNKHKPLELASKGHTYTKVPFDWKYLCRECHIEFDKLDPEGGSTV